MKAALPASVETRRGVGGAELSPAAAAFDAIAFDFDTQYGRWASVRAQRRAVRNHLERLFPPGSRLFELGGGTGDDAIHLASGGRDVMMTDASPRMVDTAGRKIEAHGLAHRVSAHRVDAERLPEVAADWQATRLAPLDGAFSNFAALNCIEDLTPVARGLATLLRPGARVALVLFGPLPPGEILVQLLHGRPSIALRRVRRGPVAARLGGRSFEVWYHRTATIRRAFHPWFELERRVGIGIFVPPSAAEPHISGYPRFLAGLEALDRMSARPLALLGDHVLYQLRRTDGGASAAI